MDAPKLFKIESQEQWQEFWVRHTSNVMPVPPLPPVDFDQDMIVAIVDRFQPNGGYALEITDVLQIDDGLTVFATRKEPGPDCITPAVITHPVHIIRLASSDLQPVPEITTEKFSC